MQEYYEHLITSAVEEAREDYLIAMKQSILDYVMAHPMERHRLGLDGLQALLVTDLHPGTNSSGAFLRRTLAPASHAALVQRQLPQAWHEHVAMAR